MNIAQFTFHETPEGPWVVLSLIGFIHLAFKAYWKIFENILPFLIEKKYVIRAWLEFKHYEYDAIGYLRKYYDSANVNLKNISTLLFPEFTYYTPTLYKYQYLIKDEKET